MKNKSSKWFPTVPGSLWAVGIFLYGVVFFLFMALRSYEKKEYTVFSWFVIGIMSSAGALYVYIRQSLCYVKLHENHLVCTIPFKKDIILIYSQCTVGMDYSVVRGRRIWWIYLCYGSELKYKFKNPRNRINALKCKDGFVRILYREDVYEELLRVLPKKQAVALTTAQRCLF